MFSLLLFCVCMLGRAIRHATTVSVEPEADIIAMGDRSTLMPAETEPAPPEEFPE